MVGQSASGFITWFTHEEKKNGKLLYHNFSTAHPGLGFSADLPFPDCTGEGGGGGGTRFEPGKQCIAKWIVSC